MDKITTNIKIISKDGGDFAYFLDKEDLYSKLSGAKDTYGENIQLNNDILKVIDINLKFENFRYTN